MPKLNKKNFSFLIIAFCLIFVLFLLPEIIVTRTIKEFYPPDGTKYNVKGWGGCTSEFIDCSHGKVVTFISSSSAEKLFSIYGNKLSHLGWIKTSEVYHENKNDVRFTTSSVNFEKDLLMRRYTMSIGKLEKSEGYPNLNNQVEIYVEFHPYTPLLL